MPNPTPKRHIFGDEGDVASHLYANVEEPIAEPSESTRLYSVESGVHPNGIITDETDNISLMHFVKSTLIYPSSKNDTIFNDDDQFEDTIDVHALFNSFCDKANHVLNESIATLVHVIGIVWYWCGGVLLNGFALAAAILITTAILTFIHSLSNPLSDHDGVIDNRSNTPENKDTSKNPTLADIPKNRHSLDTVHLSDIMGIDEAKEELVEVLNFIKHPQKYKQIGANIPRGILLVGPPGTGKTMLAKAVATEAQVPFFYSNGPEFVEIYVGQGAQRIRNLFAKARRMAPCIVFIDEIDAIGIQRASGDFSGSNREHDQTLNQLLVEMDGFHSSTGVTIIAATNRLDTLDRALLRPGRFDRIIHIPLPTVQGREAILQLYLKRVKYDKDVNLRDLAKLTPGYSGADLKNLVNEAALHCVKQGRDMVTLQDLQEARDKVGMGSVRKHMQPELERKMTAYHEAGHALVAYHLYPHADPIHKATIISRGSALGFVEQLPDGDRYSYKLAQMKARLAVCMGGRIAEELVFGKLNVTSGASSDIYAATELAYRMVTEWGMSKRLGPLNYKRLGGITSGHGKGTLSPDTAAIVEQEVRELVSEAHEVAEGILRRHRNQLERLANELLERDTLTGKEIKSLLDPPPSHDAENGQEEDPDATPDLSASDLLGDQHAAR
ncbi:bifunctional ATPase [Babesia duncani]|uniref:Bifunctional ATPase n=1 Tax=Babesia duncani TaxID=323732 RepID=A0AAD9PMM9_9APIC|nr:bifunctional ATPase [Babesia duncani]